MSFRKSGLVFLLVFLPITAASQQTMDHSEHQGHEGHQMTVELDGVVMNENFDTLPHDCSSISQEHAFTIHAGRQYAGDTPGMVFAMSQHEVRVQPCSRVQITFVNEDAVRHQWMVHGLPKYLYPAGMFHIEVAGGQRKTGTFIVPADDQTYLVHCDMAQHMEKGMRGQLVVGKGSGDLWGVAGISDYFLRDHYLPAYALALALLILVLSFLLSFRLAKKT